MTIGELQRTTGTILGQAGIVGAVDAEDCARTGLERFRDSAPHHRHLALCKYNITFGRRFADVATFKKIIENRERNKDDGRPLALLLYNKYDPKGAYESDAGDIRKLTERYRVMYYEVPTLRKATAAVLDGTKDMKASKVALAGHGDSISIQLSKYNFITADDGDFFQTLGDRIVRGADIFLPSCSTGQELAAVVSRYIPHARVHALNSGGNARLRFAPDDHILGILGLNTPISIWKGGRNVYEGNGCPANYPNITLLGCEKYACYDHVRNEWDPAGEQPRRSLSIGKILAAPFSFIKRSWEMGIGEALRYYTEEKPEEGFAAALFGIAYVTIGIIIYVAWSSKRRDDGGDLGYSINDDGSVDIWKRGWIFRRLKYTLTGLDAAVFRIIEEHSDKLLKLKKVKKILRKQGQVVTHKRVDEITDELCCERDVIDSYDDEFTAKPKSKDITGRPAPWHWRVGRGIRTFFRSTLRLGR